MGVKNLTAFGKDVSWFEQIMILSKSSKRPKFCYILRISRKVNML
jgi:hypothetical protein